MFVARSKAVSMHIKIIGFFSMKCFFCANIYCGRNVKTLFRYVKLENCQVVNLVGKNRIKKFRLSKPNERTNERVKWWLVFLFSYLKYKTLCLDG